MLQEALREHLAPDAADRFAKLVGWSSGTLSPLFLDPFCLPSLETAIRPAVGPGATVVLVDIEFNGLVGAGQVDVDTRLVALGDTPSGRLIQADTDVVHTASGERAAIRRRLVVKRESARQTRRMAKSAADSGIAQHFAAALGDRNPLHQIGNSDDVPILPGIIVLARALAQASAAVDRGVEEFGLVRARFGAPVVGSQELTLEGIHEEAGALCFRARTGGRLALKRVVASCLPWSAVTGPVSS